MNMNSILKHENENENNTKKKKRNLFLFALPVIFAGFWFFGNMIYAPTRRLKYLESIRNIDYQPQTAAVPYFDCCRNNENEINSGSWSGVLSRDKSQSVDAFLRLRVVVRVVVRVVAQV